ncbi:MAG TPA: dihydrolipoamide acetyltransferase family protein [candidate division Zixibacteria bacterium]|nr:dihydrolipoamide acetyltransferase family protein [candidate division Zixibacteria bacterium]
MDVRLPQLAEGVESGTVVSILVSEGQQIVKDQPIMELETQKAVGSIPAPESGTVTKIHVREGMEVTVGQVLISIAAVAEAGAGSRERAPASGATTERPSRTLPRRPSPAAPARREPAQENYRREAAGGLPPPAAPAVRRIASLLGIDLTRVQSSERGGRITFADLREYIRRLEETARQAPARPHADSAPSRLAAVDVVDFEKWGPVRRERLSALRRTVSRRMAASWTTVPKIDQFGDCDITGLVALREKYASVYDQRGARLTLTAFIVKAVAGALKKHPRVNSSIDEEAGEIVYKDYYHIGVAVDTEAGLIVPVLRDADKKNLLELSAELLRLTEKTRQRKVSLEELQGGTFTISNQGSIGGGCFTPIVYAPQVAILGVGRGKPTPVVRDGEIVVRTLLPLCLSYDHRVLDGADAVRFLNDVTAALESFPESEVEPR